MKSRLSLIAAALVVLLGSMVWVVQDRATISAAAAALPMAAAPTAPVTAFVPPVEVAPAFPAPAAAAPVAIPAATAAPVARREPAPRVTVNPSGSVTYVARDGDTVSQLAAALLGTDSKANRDTVVAANASLKSDPDRVLTGQAYSVGSSAAANADDVDDQQRDGAATAAARVPTTAPAERPTPSAAPAAAVDGTHLRYTAQAGDTVRGLAADFLGGDTKLNRDAIIDGNASLRRNPDQLVAGKSYRIDAPDGLSADPNAPRVKSPTTQPDADDVARLSGGRSLRYTAVAGDTVSKLAVTLLGDDTAANRDLIIQSNPGLKLNPDHVTAGQTYWIPAPAAASRE